MREKVFVVAGGPSLKNFDFSFLRDKDTIVVNKSIFNVPNPNFFVSVDYTFLKKVDRVHFKNIPTTKVFVAALGHPSLQEEDGRITDTKFNLIYRLNEYDIIIKSRKQDGVGLTFYDFRTGKNSGFCALQLAIVLGYKEIYLLGVDLNITSSFTHYHGGYGESREKFNAKLPGYFEYFKIGLEQLREKSDIQVFSCSENSSLNSIIAYKNLMEAIRE